MISSRSIQILNLLLEKRKPISLGDLSEYFSLSERSIRYEIEKNNMLEILKGECVVRDYNAIENFLRTVEKYIPSYEERELYIMLKISFERYINQSDISKELDLSKSTIKVHLREIRKKLMDYNLKLELLPKKGLEIIGEEEQIRQLTLRTLVFSERLESKFLKNIINKYIGNIDVKGIKIFINYCQKLMNLIISDEAYSIISKYVQLMIYFNKREWKITNIKNSKFLESTFEYKCVEQSKALIEGYYEMEILEEEYLKITDYFLGSHTYNISCSYYENWVEIEITVRRLIELVNKKIDVDISKDETLFLELVNHIKPTIYRIKNKIVLDNSIYKEVIESYPKLFITVKDSVRNLENFIDEKFTDDEIAFLTVHFKLAMDRNVKNKKEKLKVLLICASGYGSSKLLAQQLKDRYRVKIVDTIPRYLFEKKMKTEEVDLVLTTVSIDNYMGEQKIIQVNPILTQEDLKKLDEFPVQKDNKKIIFSELLEVLEKNSNIEINEKLIESLKVFLDNKLIDDIFQKKVTLLDSINENMIKVSGGAKNWKDAIREAGDILVESNCITEDYIEDMIEVVEEYGDYIMLVPGVLFPHAQSTGNVKKTGFAFIKYDSEIEFLNEKKIKFVIAFCSKDKREHLNILNKIITEFEENELENKIKDVNSSKKILEYFKGD
ncbi:BglG family transcription antiterminator [Fusobacterium sp. MFO224]|uniref:BglG family transcription antiterminator n=1 Tax=Fusobacterium sp. MFO224 TaxID=3378070 RepID=UPI003853E13D